MLTSLAPARTGPPPPQFSDSDLPTVDAVIEEKRRQTRTDAPPPPEPAPAEQSTAKPLDEGEPGQESPEALEEQAGQEGAFNPETGEINWDCPCLGGMAHGPCGEDFKAAFSCFVYSEDEPKGMECIDKFQYVSLCTPEWERLVANIYRHMRDCFRKYPEIYGAELEDDDDDDGAAPPAPGAESGGDDSLPEPSKPQPVEKSPTVEDSTPPAQPPADATESAQEPAQELKEAKQEAKQEDAETTIPKKAVDATDANTDNKQS